MCPQAEPLRFEGDRAAAAERIADGWCVLPQIAQYGFCVVGWRRRVATGAGQRARNLEPRLVQDSRVVGRLPRHHLGDDRVQPRPLPLLVLLGRELLRPRRRIVHELREQHRPARRERPPRPPQVQGRGMAVPDRLLPHGCTVDGVEGQGYLDQLPATGGSHGPESGRSRPSRAGAFSPGGGIGELLGMAVPLLPVCCCTGRQDEGGRAGVGSAPEAISSEIVTPPNRFANPAPLAHLYHAPNKHSYFQ